MRPPLSKQGPTSPAQNGSSVLLSAGRDVDQVVGNDSAQFRSGAATTSHETIRLAAGAHDEGAATHSQPPPTVFTANGGFVPFGPTDDGQRRIRVGGHGSLGWRTREIPAG